MQVRQATTDDLGYVYETFLHSFRAASTHAEDLTGKATIGLLSALVERRWRVMVADAEGYLTGWACFAQDNHLAWIYVREMFRFGNYKDHDVCDLLIQAAGIDTKKRIVTPFLPTRVKRTWQFVHRPFLIAA